MKKEKITDEDVINEFEAINNNSNKLLIFLVVILLLALSGTIYLLVSKNDIINRVIDKLECNKCTGIIDNDGNCINNKEEEKEDITITRKEQIINTTVGTFILDKDGHPYFINNSEIEYQNIDKIGNKNNYELIKYKEDDNCSNKTCKYQSYKLDIKKINGMYQISFDKDNNDISIIFISQDGYVSELLFQYQEENKYKVELHKNIFDHDDIISAISNEDVEEGKYLLLVDKYGNNYQYFGVVSMREW